MHVILVYQPSKWPRAIDLYNFGSIKHLLNSKLFVVIILLLLPWWSLASSYFLQLPFSGTYNLWLVPTSFTHYPIISLHGYKADIFYRVNGIPCVYIIHCEMRSPRLSSPHTRVGIFDKFDPQILAEQCVDAQN